MRLFVYSTDNRTTTRLHIYETLENKKTYTGFDGSIFNEGKQMTLVPMDDQLSLGDIELESDTGYKNKAIELTGAQLLDNIRAIQSENNIKVSDKLIADVGRCSLDIEMETGTGKTYVYIKTMFELNKRYGWSKFIVVVPSIAIREGVNKTFQITADHFMEQYGKKARFFIYNSSTLTSLTTSRPAPVST